MIIHREFLFSIRSRHLAITHKSSFFLKGGHRFNRSVESKHRLGLFQQRPRRQGTNQQQR